MAKEAELDAERVSVRRKAADLEGALAVLSKYGLEVPQADATAQATDAGDQTKAAAVMVAVVHGIREHKHMHVAELVPYLMNSHGINIVQANLSTILSRNKGAYGLKTDRRLGWCINDANGHDGLVSGGDLGLVVEGIGAG